MHLNGAMCCEQVFVNSIATSDIFSAAYMVPVLTSIL